MPRGRRGKADGWARQPSDMTVRWWRAPNFLRRRATNFQTVGVEFRADRASQSRARGRGDATRKMADGDEDDEFAVNIREAGPSIPALDLDRCTQCCFLARSAPWRPCSLCGRATGAWQRRRRPQPNLRARPRAAPPRPLVVPPTSAASAAEIDLDAAIEELPPAAAAAADDDDDEFAVNVRRPSAASLDDKIAALEAELQEMDEDEDAGPMPPTPSGSDSDGGGGSDDEPAAAGGAAGRLAGAAAAARRGRPVLRGVRRARHVVGADARAPPREKAPRGGEGVGGARRGPLLRGVRHLLHRRRAVCRAREGKEAQGEGGP